jgi:hypothetical protein
MEPHRAQAIYGNDMYLGDESERHAGAVYGLHARAAGGSEGDVRPGG